MQRGMRYMGEFFKNKCILASYMKWLIIIKISVGISAQRIKWIRKKFNDFANVQKLSDLHIAEELVCK